MLCVMPRILYPSIGGAPAYRACCSCITESFNDARCTFETCNPRQDGHMKVDLKLSLNSHALPPFSWLFIFPIGWSPIQPVGLFLNAPC